MLSKREKEYVSDVSGFEQRYYSDIARQKRLSIRNKFPTALKDIAAVINADFEGKVPDSEGFRFGRDKEAMVDPADVETLISALAKKERYRQYMKKVVST
jgi:hypothetical protein